MIKRMALMSAMVLMACAGGQKTSSVEHVQGPEWVRKGSGAFSGEKGKVFYGVGIADHIPSKALLRSTAEDRARANLAQTLDTYVARLAKDYQSSTTAGNQSSAEQNVTVALKSYTQMELSGAQIVDTYEERNDDGTTTMYALSQLDMASFKDGMDKMRNLNAQVKEAVKANADKAFDELSGEEAKRAQ